MSAMIRTVPTVLIALITALPSTASDEMQWRERFQSVTSTNFDQGGAVSHQFHLHAESYLTTATVTAPSRTRTLPVRLDADLAELSVRHRNGEDSFSSYVAAEPWISSVIVLQAGEVVFEAYPRMQPEQRHLAWSVSKAITGAVLAALVHDSRIDLGRTVSHYIPELTETSWSELTVRDVANMASGINCLDSDGYQDPTTCVYRMEEALGITADRGYEAGLMEHFAGMGRRRPPGEVFEYVSANTNMLGLIAEAASGQPFATLLSEQIWRPIGAESDALLAINQDGYSYASGGVIARLRDIARLGEIFMKPARFGVLSDTLIDAMQYRDGVSFNEDRQASLDKEFSADAPKRAAWQWDLIWADGGMYKGGYLGQGLYVDPDRELVIAWFGTGEDFNAKRNDMPSVSRQIARSGVFGADA